MHMIASKINICMEVSMDFNREDSFYANENGTFIVIFVWGNQPAKLYVVPETFKKIVYGNLFSYNV